MASTFEAPHGAEERHALDFCMPCRSACDTFIWSDSEYTGPDLQHFDVTKHILLRIVHTHLRGPCYPADGPVTEDCPGA